MTEQIQTIGAEYNALINQGSTMRERVAVMIVDSQESKVQAADVLAALEQDEASAPASGEE